MFRVTCMIRCPNTDVFAVLTGSLVPTNGTRALVGESCNLRKDLIAKAFACDRACGIGTPSSPLRKDGN